MTLISTIVCFCTSKYQSGIRLCGTGTSDFCVIQCRAVDGINVSSALIVDAQPDDTLMQKIRAKEQAKQDAEIAELNKQTALAQAETDKVKAQTEADVKMIEAQAEADESWYVWIYS